MRKRRRRFHERVSRWYHQARATAQNGRIHGLRAGSTAHVALSGVAASAPPSPGGYREENARAFQEQNGAEKSFTDYREMLEKERLDAVSICNLAAHLVRADGATRLRQVARHLLEKPMATTFGDAKRMVTTREKTGALLAFCHQRRFNSGFPQGERDPRQVGPSASCVGWRRRSNLFDWGTHWFDTSSTTTTTWSNGPSGRSTSGDTRPAFGAPCEGQGRATPNTPNGVRGLMITGYECRLRARATG